MRHLGWSCLTILFVLFLSFGIAAAGGLEPTEDESERMADETSDWLKRVDWGFSAGTDVKPTYYFQTVQPLYQSYHKDETLFIQPRVNIVRDSGTEVYNLGLGYRWLTPDESRLYGLNTFYDYSAEHSHYRVGVGSELLGKILEARLNTYWGLSSRRTVSRTGASATYEKVVDGLDFELGGPFIPHLPWIKLYGSGFWYDYKHGDDCEGWKLRTRLQRIKTSSLDFILWDDNKGDTEFQIDCRITIPFDTWQDILDSFERSDEPYPDRDLKEEMLEPVERDYNIKVEKWIETVGTTIEVKRGDN